MGGNLFKVHRVGKTRYQQILGLLTPVLDLNLEDHYRIPIPYHNKLTYGDVDIIVDAGFVLNKDWLTPILNALGNPEYKKIRNVTSLHYEDFQVDFFCVGSARFESTYNFMCYNILGNLMGRIFHKFNLKYGEEGLSYVMRGFNDRISKEVTLSRQMKPILEFIDLDYDRWVKGFDNLTDIFEYVIGSKYFCSKSYSPDYFNVRKRAVERPDFNAFLDYLIENGIEKNYPFVRERETYIPLISQAFPESNLEFKYQQHLDHQIIAKAISQKFNGTVIMGLFPDLKDAELGKFIGEYKKIYGDQLNTHLLNTNQEDINQSIIRCYHHIYKK